MERGVQNRDIGSWTKGCVSGVSVETKEQLEHRVACSVFLRNCRVKQERNLGE